MLLVYFTFAQQELSVKWNKGFQAKDSTGNFKFKIGARTFFDIAYINQSASIENKFGKQTLGGEFRKAMFQSSGKIHGNVKYITQFDFSSGTISFNEVWIEINKVPIVGNIRLGNFKEPMRFENLTSSKSSLAMENSFTAKMLPGYASGMLLHKYLVKNKINLQFAAVLNSDAVGKDLNNDEKLNLDGRIVYLPLKNENSFMHTSIYYSYRTNKNKSFTWKFRPESHIANNYINFNLNAENMNVVGFEYIFSHKQFTLHTEYLSQNINEISNDKYFYSYVIYGVWRITGESRKYKDPLSGYDTFEPKKNVSEGGIGGLEFVVRYSEVDLENYGKIQNITTGLNWYLNSNTRFMINYIISNLDGIGLTQIVQMRTQINF